MGGKWSGGVGGMKQEGRNSGTRIFHSEGTQSISRTVCVALYVGRPARLAHGVQQPAMESLMAEVIRSPSQRSCAAQRW